MTPNSLNNVIILLSMYLKSLRKTKPVYSSLYFCIGGDVIKQTLILQKWKNMSERYFHIRSFKVTTLRH